eukprot:3972639-Alexandrium_andersonii.AAC.1
MESRHKVRETCSKSHRQACKKKSRTHIFEPLPNPVHVWAPNDDAQQAASPHEDESPRDNGENQLEKEEM